MIETNGLIKQYGGVTVLDLPNLKVNKGESFGLVGNNGAGKTTFFSLILDLIEASEGNVLSKGSDVKQSEHWKAYTGSYLDERFIIDFLTPEEYLSFISGLHKLSQSQFDEFLTGFEEFFNDEILNKKKYIRELSKGNQKKLGIAAAMMANPEVLILDEPFPHLDPTSVNRLIKLLKFTNKKNGTTLLVSSHNLNYVTEVNERIAILEKGKIIYDLRTDDKTLTQLYEYFSA